MYIVLTDRTVVRETWSVFAASITRVRWLWGID